MPEATERHRLDSNFSSNSADAGEPNSRVDGLSKKSFGAGARAFARSRLQWCDKIVDYFEVCLCVCVYTLHLL
jgi:hypothetical protein